MAWAQAGLSPSTSRNGADAQSALVGELAAAFTPRLGTPDRQHVAALAECYDRLPSILVHRETMAVIDGIHRLAAARLLGHRTIPIQFFDGSEAEAFIEAVRANVAHGKPLERPEREHAAQRILELHPDWSDRRVGEICGLSPKTVATIRPRVTGESPQLRGRLGRDGRVRPTDPAQVRIKVVELLRAFPDLSARRLAREVGTSQATVLDVRRRIDRGEDPLPARLQPAVPTNRAVVREVRNPPGTEFGERDSACTATSEGRQFLHWFETHSISEEEALGFVEDVPLSRVYVVAETARRQAAIWQCFAARLESRAGGRSRCR